MSKAAINRTLGRTLLCVVVGMLALSVNTSVHADPRGVYKAPQQTQLKHVLRPLRHAQSQRASENKNFRSRSEVVQEVKRRYNARVLKISLNQNRSVYSVRILMPNGKVRNLKVSALR